MDDIPLQQDHSNEAHRVPEALHSPLDLQALFPFILNSLDEYAIAVLDRNARILSWNTGAELVTGFKSSEMCGRHFSVLFVPEDIAIGAPELEMKTANLRGKAIDERFHVRRDSAPFLATGFLFCLKDSEGRHVGYTKIFRDATEMKELERQKDESVGVVSHELKTPITGIKGYAEILSQRLSASGDETLLKPLTRIISLTDRLTGLVNYLLEVSRSQSVEIKMSPEEFCIESLIVDVIDEVSASTRRTHTIEFDSHAETMVLADRGRIAQVLTNLFTNAIKYSPGHHSVEASLSREGSYALFKVRDHGLGIPEDQQNLLFKRFARSQNVKRLKLPGVGLGLYISAEIIKMHQGEIGFESTEHEGSTFWFRIPVNPIQEQGIFS